MMEEIMKRKIKYYPLFLFVAIFLIFGLLLAEEKIFVQVGPNIRASGETVQGGRNECWIAASLTDPDFLVGISHAGQRQRICPVIFSKDGGQTWKEVIFPHGNEGFDPLVLAGPDDIMYAMVCGLGMTGLGRKTLIWSTKDKAKTWQGPTEIYSYSLDHPRMAVDTTGGSFHGRLYYAWNEVSDSIEKGKYNIYLHYSDDEGKSFFGPKQLHKEEGGKLVMIDLVVLSDGTLIVPYYQYYWPLEKKKNENQPVWILTSTDGGNTFSGPHKITTVGMSAWLEVKKDFPSAFTLPIVTADVSKSSPYRDRMYIVWDDATRTGESTIWLIWSKDKGKTWSERVKVNDNPPSTGRGPRDFRMTPIVAVNKEGIVGVAWYDRRDDPARRCWDYYTAFSLDGGQTFGKNYRISSSPSCPEKNMSPSIRITNISPEPKEEEKEKEKEEESEEQKKEEQKKEEPKIPSLEVSFDRGRSVWPGHYTGLTVDTKGRFHALWADRRNGPQELYAAVVEVLHKKPAIPPLSEEMDITDKVRLVAGKAKFDEAKGISTFTLQIQNVSKKSIFAPLKLIVSRMEKGWKNLDTLEILNSDNQHKAVGAAWDFSKLVGSNKELRPREITEAREIKIKTFVEAGLDGKIEFKVLGKVLKN